VSVVESSSNLTGSSAAPSRAAGFDNQPPILISEEICSEPNGTS